MSTDDYFSGRRSSAVTRRFVFTDRSPEKNALLGRVYQATRSSSVPLDMAESGSPAKNLTVVWGTGGIGKSALLDEVQREFMERASANVTPAIVKFDFSDYANHDLEALLLRLASGLVEGSCTSRRGSERKSAVEAKLAKSQGIVQATWLKLCRPRSIRSPRREFARDPRLDRGAGPATPVRHGAV